MNGQTDYGRTNGGPAEVVRVSVVVAPGPVREVDGHRAEVVELQHRGVPVVGLRLPGVDV